MELAADAEFDETVRIKEKQAFERGTSNLRDRKQFKNMIHQSVPP